MAGREGPVGQVAVVGAGVTGLFVSHELRRLGVDAVTVYERTGIGAGASGVQPGGIRQQWGTAINCLLARESLATYRDAQARLEMRVDPCFRACGYLFLAHSAETLARLAANVELQNGLGVASWIVEPDEAAQLVPGLDPSSARRRGVVRRGRLPRSSPGGARGAGRARVGGPGRRRGPQTRRVRVEALLHRWRDRHGRERRRGCRMGVARARPGATHRAGSPVPLPERPDSGATARPARDLSGASLRSQAARRRPRARQRSHGRRRPRPRTRQLAKPRASLPRGALAGARVRLAATARGGLLRRHA